MKKLSKLPNDILLAVQQNCYTDVEVMTKEEFLSSPYFTDGPCDPPVIVTIAEKTVEKFDLRTAIENIGEDNCYDGWIDEVFDSIKATPITEKFINTLNAIFAAHPTYWPGEDVEIDMSPNTMNK